MRRLAAAVCCSAVALLPLCACLDNGVGRTPAMGWAPWNAYGPEIDENIMKKEADLLVSTGLTAAGYEYVIVDDKWSNLQRSPEGRLVANTTTFPSGMKALGDYIHNLGLKFGMYSDAGTLTCQFHPGSLGHESEDADSFASWGVDYLKYDNCHAEAKDWVVDRYAAMGAALNQTGRPILYSIVGWGVGDPWLGWGAQIGNSWRTDGDITASWEAILRPLDNTIGLSQYAGPGGFNDPDMLEVGVGLLTLEEQRSHFALWALYKAPLLLGAQLATLNPDQMAIVSAKEVIAVNQDPLGVAGDLVWKQGPNEVHAGPLEDGSRAVVLFNRHTLATQYPFSNISVRWDWIGFPPDAQALVRDLFTEKDVGTFVGSFTAQVNIHDGIMLRVSLLKDAETYSGWRPWTARLYPSEIPAPDCHSVWGIQGLLAVLLGAVVGGALFVAGRCALALCRGDSKSDHRRKA